MFVLPAAKSGFRRTPNWRHHIIMSIWIQFEMRLAFFCRRTKRVIINIDPMKKKRIKKILTIENKRKMNKNGKQWLNWKLIKLRLKRHKSQKRRATIEWHMTRFGHILLFHWPNPIWIHSHWPNSILLTGHLFPSLSI